MAELLVEVGLEEIPARMIASAEEELTRRMIALLARAGLQTDEGASDENPVRHYSTPRRLAVHLSRVLDVQAGATEVLTGPAWKIAFKEGVPTPAAHAFAKKAGVSIEAFEKVSTPKGEYVSAIVQRVGRPASEVLAAELPKEIAALSWPKNMYWRAGKPERYVRPVKWLLALLDHAILPIEFAGVHASNLTYGHRIMHGAHAVTINHPREYVQALESAKVMADVATRRHTIRKALDHATRTVTDARWRENESLIESVVHLTEWPSVVLGEFEREYLALPEEVLVTVMRDHQKYFAVEDREGKLAPYFLAVLNTDADGSGLIRHGNERVLRARFSDARFFWEFDQKISIQKRRELLRSVTFHKELGTYYEKTNRTAAIAQVLAEAALEQGAVVDTNALRTAAHLAKTDLTTELVKEFTELQGIVGGLYARREGYEETVVAAIYSQYQPSAITDPIPQTTEGQLLGLADRIGTLVDLFALGLAPTGSKDPYSLRRAGNAIASILAQSDLPLSLAQVIAADDVTTDAVKQSLGSFFRERLDFYLREVMNFTFDVVNAVLARGYDDVADTIARARVLSTERHSEDLAAISIAFKRIKNILRQAGWPPDVPSPETAVQDYLLYEPAEVELCNVARSLSDEVLKLQQERNYQAALKRIATLRPHVDRFFDENVRVNSDNEALTKNRLALLGMISAEFSSIADFSELVAGSD